MSTRSTIRLVRDNGTSKKIYCHYDGYIEGVGLTLQLAYNTADKIEELLELGNLSSLGYYINPTTDEHSFENPERDICVAYHRDRGEELEFISDVQEEEFNYTFYESNGCWYVRYGTYRSSKYRQTEAMKKLDLDYVFTIKENLLLDEILKLPDTNLNDWIDDDFAKHGEVKATCIKKAREPRTKILEEQAEREAAYYKAYCD